MRFIEEPPGSPAFAARRSATPGRGERYAPGPAACGGPAPVNCVRGDQRGFTAYGLPFTVFEISAIVFCALTLLPAASSGGETTAMPNRPGQMAMMPPPTPLFPGRPVR